jgi:2-C-methyl-D-erythritol 4-phosphate cytidylyltransferase
LDWCLRSLRAAESVGPIVVAVPEGTGEAFGDDVRTVAGGASRAESVANAMELVESDTVVVHDAARPLAGPGLFDAVLSTLREQGCDAVVAAAPVTDTIKEIAHGMQVDRTLDRSSLWAAQTPQAFRTEALRDALASTVLLAQATDEAMLVERLGGRVIVHAAPEENIKVTTQADLKIAELLLSARND